MKQTAKYDNGIPWYTVGVAHVAISFPTDDVKCGYCPHCRDDSMGRFWCRLTNSLVYSLETIADNCPIEFDEKEEN